MSSRRRAERRRRQLDRQRQPVEPIDQLHQRSLVVALHLTPGTLPEQLQRTVEGQRFKRVDGLGGAGQHLPAGHQHGHPGAGGEQLLGQPGHRCERVLAVVEHQQGLLPAERRRQLRRGARLPEPDAGQVGQLSDDGVRGDRYQVEPQHAAAHRRPGQVRRQPALADAGRPDHADQPLLVEQQRQRRDVRDPVDKGPRQGGRPARPGRAAAHPHRFCCPWVVVGTITTEMGCLVQDVALQGAQSRPGLDAQLLAQALGGPPGRVQRFGLTPGPVERQHQLLPPALAVGLGLDQRRGPGGRAVQADQQRGVPTPAAPRRSCAAPRGSRRWPSPAATRRRGRRRRRARAPARVSAAQRLGTGQHRAWSPPARPSARTAGDPADPPPARAGSHRRCAPRRDPPRPDVRAIGSAPPAGPCGRTAGAWSPTARRAARRCSPGGDGRPRGPPGPIPADPGRRTAHPRSARRPGRAP